MRLLTFSFLFLFGVLTGAVLTVFPIMDYSYERGSMDEAKLEYHCAYEYLEPRDYIGNPAPKEVLPNGKHNPKYETSWQYAVDTCIEGMYGAEEETKIITRWPSLVESLAGVFHYYKNLNGLTLKDFIRMQSINMFPDAKADERTEPIKNDWTGYWNGKNWTPFYLMRKNFEPDEGEVPTFNSPAEVIKYRVQQSFEYDAPKPNLSVIYLPYQDTAVCVRYDHIKRDTCFSLYDLTER